MTNQVKYVKIISMKQFILSKFKILITTLCILFATFTTASFITLSTVNADNALLPTSKLVLPSTQVEYLDITSPIGIYSDSSVTAIMQDGDPTSLLIHMSGKTTEFDSLQLTDVAKLNDNTLIIATSARLKQIDLTSFDPLSPESSITSYPLNTADDIATSFFDISENYLITAYHTRLSIFSRESIPTQIGKDISIDNNSHIAINSDDKIFCVSNGEIYRYELLENSVTYSSIATASPTDIIADEEFVYYVEDNKIYKLSVDGGSPIELSVIGDEKHQLGNLTINSNTRISFHNGNFLITDTTLNAVQEFSLSEDNKLVFTGYAMAKGKTAFNRISGLAKEIERQGDTLAVLDADRLSLINYDKNFNPYERNNFSHFYYQDINGEIPDNLALSDNNALLLFGKNTENSYLKTIDLETLNISEQSFTIFPSNFIRDIFYQNGKYYIIADENNGKSAVYSTDLTLSSFQTVIEEQELSFSQICLDVSNNLYLYTNDGKIFKSTFTNGLYETPVEMATMLGVKAMSTDLGCSLFVLTDNGIHTLNNTTWQDYSLPQTYTTATPLDFALGIDRHEILLYNSNEELLCSISGLDNLSIDTTAIPSDFKITDNNADLSKFKVVNITEEYSAFAVEVDNNSGNFKYLSPADATDYLSICSLTIKDGLNRQKSFSILIGQNQTVIAPHVTDATPEIDRQVPLKVFTTTTVNAYYLPIITQGDLYTLKAPHTIRLEKHLIAMPSAKIVFLDKEFYFAEVSLDQTVYNCYIPVSFTVEILNEDYEWESFSTAKVKSTKVYAEQQCETVIANLKDGTKIRILSKENGIAKIAFQTENGWARGYMRTSAIKNEANTTVRNILIIIAVMASICGTTTYFVLRKKD